MCVCMAKALLKQEQPQLRIKNDFSVFPLFFSLFFFFGGGEGNGKELCSEVKVEDFVMQNNKA